MSGPYAKVWWVFLRLLVALKHKHVVAENVPEFGFEDSKELCGHLYVIIRIVACSSDLAGRYVVHDRRFCSI